VLEGEAFDHYEQIWWNRVHEYYSSKP